MTLAYDMQDARGARPACALAEVIQTQGVRLTFGRNAEIYSQDEEVEMLYRVVKGAVRTSRFSVDGRRQIGEFYYPGDVFGLEVGPQHRFTAEALTDCVVQAVRRSSVRAFAGDGELDRAILEATRRELERAQGHVLMLGLKNAREKVAAFLLTLAQAQPEGACDLPMSRQDMADYLSLTIETVSRMLTQLQAEEIVEFPASRSFRVREWETLEALAA